jgi:hypothetical protein
VQVTIDDQIAVTHVDQVFYNPNDWQVEGTYMFPIPLDAAVSGFTLWVDGEPVEGKVLDADEARRTYERSSLPAIGSVGVFWCGVVRSAFSDTTGRGTRVSWNTSRCCSRMVWCAMSTL